MDERDAVTEDRLLGGRLVLRQPMAGLRATIDPVLLAAAVPARAGDRVLDLGTGTGVAALCLLARIPGVHAVGIDIQPDLVGLAVANAALNGAADRFHGLVGDVAAPPSALTPDSFDHVLANPPYAERGSGTLPPDPPKALALAESESRLADWVGTALALVRPSGAVVFVQRADRLDALLAALHGRAGAIEICPLWPAAGKPARRVIVRARRERRTPLALSAGLVLHGSDGAFSEAADAVLRDAAALDF